MKRYFDSFFNHDPMEELSEAIALESGSYVVEDDLTMRRYRRVINHQLDSIVYAGWDDPSEPLADLERLGEKVRAEIYSPVEQLPNNAHK